MKQYSEAEELAEKILKHSQALANTDFDIDREQFERLKTRIDIARGYLNKAEIQHWVEE